MTPSPDTRPVRLGGNLSERNERPLRGTLERGSRIIHILLSGRYSAAAEGEGPTTMMSLSEEVSAEIEYPLTNRADLSPDRHLLLSKDLLLRTKAIQSVRSASSLPK
ncbi:ribosomal RNA small subunit methyltransferase A [Striga asiatica]|uniref:Ribosomal RNA small subunit methyltransferase A n=1 Tax=Striga asiatica TaxID=4170 RepID=A0A5A7QKW3_STRAF|nr:ribosomal RNA small subunit methyltransferase A [Striga asiatica]